MTARAAPRHRMADWLELHAVEAVPLLGFLDRWAEAGQQPTGAQGAGDRAHGMTPGQAWAFCADALLAGLGADLAAAVRAARDHSRLVPGALPKGMPRAVTLPDGGNGYPLVTCPFGGGLRDLVTLAHEMGHAVHFVACAGHAPPPVLRETCAFVAEGALAAHVARQAPDLLEALETIRQRETARIMAGPLAALRAALDRPDAPYDYAWNYPVARILAARGDAAGRWFRPGARLSEALAGD